MEYQNFDLHIRPEGDKYIARVEGLGGSHKFDKPFSAEELDEFYYQAAFVTRNVRTQGEDRSGLSKDKVKDFGSRLFDTVFQGKVRENLSSSLGVGGNNPLRLRLCFEDAAYELASLPWEYLYDTLHDGFLGLSTETPIIRYLEIPQSIKPLTLESPLEILIVAIDSDHPGYAKLQVEKELENLKTILADLENQGLIRLSVLKNASKDDLHDELRKHGCHILHFIGHGDFNAVNGEAVLLFKDGEMSNDDLRTLVRNTRDKLRVVVLNSCKGARSTKHDPFVGMAQSVMQAGIPAVVAMQFAITDDAAIGFSRKFYQCIADHTPIDVALAEARVALKLKNQPLTEWGTPVLFMRSEDGILFKGTEIQEPLEILQQSANNKLDALIEALLGCPTIIDDNSRNTLIGRLPGKIKTSIKRDSRSDIDVTNIVNACLQYRDGLPTLINILGSYEHDSIPMEKVKEISQRFRGPDR